MKRKLVAMMAVMSMAAGLLAGCGGSSADTCGESDSGAAQESEGASGDEADGKTTISFWHYMSTDTE